MEMFFFTDTDWIFLIQTLTRAFLWCVSLGCFFGVFLWCVSVGAQMMFDVVSRFPAENGVLCSCGVFEECGCGIVVELLWNCCGIVG
jgi:hypothetical protein